MSKPKTTTTVKLGRKPNPEGRKRFYWLGAHCTYAEKLQTQALAEREMPGRPFAVWMRGRIGLGAGTPEE